MTKASRSARRGLAAAALGAAFLAGDCRAKSKGPPPVETVPVAAAKVERRDVPIEISAIGHVEALSAVEVKTRVGGEVTQVGFREGQDVKPGDLLFVVDPRPYEAALFQAKARLERDRALAKNAEETAARYAELVKKDFVTPQQYDEMRANAAAAQATARADEASVRSAELDLSYCRIESPIEGRTGSVLVHKGNILKANDDRTLVSINQIHPIAVAFTAPESSLDAIRAKFRNAGKLVVKATPPDASAEPESGELSFIDNAVDATTGTIRLKGMFANPGGTLWPGQYVNVVLSLSMDPNAVVIPTQALQNGQQGQYVFVVKRDMTVETRPVTVARTQGKLAVITRGLQPDEQVVTDGQLRLSPGAKVEVKPSEGSAS